jgi:hypothetical protein
MIDHYIMCKRNMIYRSMPLLKYNFSILALVARCATSGGTCAYVKGFLRMVVATNDVTFCGNHKVVNDVSVTSTVPHKYIVHVLGTKSNLCFSIGRTHIVGTSLLQFSEGTDAHYTAITFRYVHVRTLNLTS